MKMSALALAAALVPILAAAAPAAAQTGPGVLEISRTNLITGDVDRLKAFYADVFGFTVADQTVVGVGPLRQVIADQWSLPAGQSLYTVILKTPRGETTLGVTGVQGGAIGALPRHRIGPPMAGDHYLILRVADIDEIKRRLDSRGVQMWRPVMRVTGAREMGAFDPDGTRLIIIEQDKP